MRDYIHSALAQTGRVNSRQLSASSMPELLNLAHAIEVGAINNLSSELRFEVTQSADWLVSTPRIEQDDYFVRRDEFVIALIENNHGKFD